MSDSIESRSSEIPAISEQLPRADNSKARERTKAFLQKLFANGAHIEECFGKICDSGCPRDEFAQFLWATSTLMSFQNAPLVNGGNLTKAQLKGLPKRLRALAEI